MDNPKQSLCMHKPSRGGRTLSLPCFHDSNVSICVNSSAQKRPNPLKPIRTKWLASPLLIPITMIAIGVGLIATSCVIPPPLSIGDVDAATNAPPVIVSAGGADFSFPGPIQLQQNDTRRITLSVSEANTSDTSYLYFYIDYDPAIPTPVWSQCTAPAGDKVRVADCPTDTLCNGISDTSFHVLEVLVADRERLDEGDPAFRAFPVGTESSLRAWTLFCEP